MIDSGCLNCGACCANQPLPPSTSKELGRLPNELMAEIIAVLDAQPFDDDAPCLWRDGDAKCCKHYGFRPAICQEFEPGEEGCMNCRAACSAEEQLRAAEAVLKEKT